MSKKTKMPDTSREAGQLKTNESKQRDYDKIVNALLVIKSGHYEQIARQMKVKDIVIVARRLSEMVKNGVIRNTGLKKNTSRNRAAYIYELVDGTPRTPTQLVDDIITAAIKPIFDNPLFNILNQQ